MRKTEFKKGLRIVEDNQTSIDQFHSTGWGGTDTIITKEDLEKLLNGKLLGLNDGEYTHLFKYEGGN